MKNYALPVRWIIPVSMFLKPYTDCFLFVCPYACFLDKRWPPSQEAADWENCASPEISSVIYLCCQFLFEANDFFSHRCCSKQRLCFSVSFSSSPHVIIRTKKATQVRNEIAEVCFFCRNEHKWLIKAIESALPVVSGGVISWALEPQRVHCSCGAWVQLIATGVLFPVWTF